MSRKILTIIGARPQFIKAAAVSRALQATPGLEEMIIHTGQHFDDNMSRVFFEELNIPQPAINLEVHSLGHGAMTGRMLESIEKIMVAEKPDVVMVYGDTNSTLAGSLAAAKLHIPVAHVEAGLRSFNMEMPEEINRILTDRISSLLFCPTNDAIKNLNNEGFGNFPCRIIQTGDVMYDAALFYAPRAQKPQEEIPEENFILATLHRAENTDRPERLREIFSAMEQIAVKFPVVLPLHPRTRSILKKHNIHPDPDKIIITQPFGYLNMIYALQKCHSVMTDSGGLQKEAYFFRKPCITLRTETEWTELIQAGVNRLGGYTLQGILDAWTHFQENPVVFPESLYGEGNASNIIAQELLI